MNFEQIHKTVTYLKQNNKMYMIDDIIKNLNQQINESNKL
jgi:hypothetical protein